METILGFVAGYWAGCRDGRDGVARLRDSVDAIRNSPEARKLATEGLMFARVMLRRAAAGRGISGLGDTVGTVSDMLAHGRASRGRAA
jgi:hypothetical protein